LKKKQSSTNDLHIKAPRPSITSRSNSISASQNKAVIPTSRQSTNQKQIDEIHALLVRLDLAERRAKNTHESVLRHKQAGRLEESLDAEESFHAFSLEVSKLKKTILYKENTTLNNNNNNNSKSQNGSMLKKSASEPSPTVRSRECKIHNNNQPPVDTSSYNDEGDCVPEGIIYHRIKVSKRPVQHVRMTSKQLFLFNVIFKMLWTPA